MDASLITAVGIVTVPLILVTTHVIGIVLFRKNSDTLWQRGKKAKLNAPIVEETQLKPSENSNGETRKLSARAA